MNGVICCIAGTCSVGFGISVTVRTKCSDPLIRAKSIIVVLCVSYDSWFASSATVRKVAESSIF